MIIDLILDRKDGKQYRAKDFYGSVMGYGEIGYPIATALDSGTNEDIKDRLCDYIIKQDYNTSICEYIKSVKWTD